LPLLPHFYYLKNLDSSLYYVFSFLFIFYFSEFLHLPSKVTSSLCIGCEI
jgi:hypothetical protein